MATEVVMPKLGLTMERGTLGAWLAEEGQTVEKGEPLLEVVTDKVTMEVEAQASGVLCKILVPAGVEVEVATLVGIIADADEDISALLEAQPLQNMPAVEKEASGPEPAAAGEEPRILAASELRASGGKRHRASPKARKMIAAEGIDEGQLTGSGPGGRIVSADIESYLAQRPAAPRGDKVVASQTIAPLEEGGLVALTRPQQFAAERLTASSRDLPHIHVSMDVSAVWLQQLRQGYKIEGKKISFNDLVVRATGRTLVEFPRLNSILEGDKVRQFDQVNIGIAADTPQGLMVPVLHDVPGKDIEEIASASIRLIDAARHGDLQPDDLMGGTFTISNLGMFGVSHFTAIINPPQVAILAVGAIENRVVVLENNALAAQPQLTLTLAADHRVIDGALAARFLQRLKGILENPGLLG